MGGEGVGWNIPDTLILCFFGNIVNAIKELFIDLRKSYLHGSVPVMPVTCHRSSTSGHQAEGSIWIYI